MLRDREVPMKEHHQCLGPCLRDTYLASVLHVVLLSRMRAEPGAGAGCAWFGATQDNGILVQVPGSLHGDTDRPRLLTDVIARDTERSGSGNLS